MNDWDDDEWDPSKQDSTGQVIEPGLDNRLDYYDAIVNDWDDDDDAAIFPDSRRP